MTGRRVVVGVDDTPGSRAALALALGMAAERDAALDVVATYPVHAAWTGGTPVDVPDVAAVRADLAARVGDLVAEVRRDPAVAALPGAGALDVRLVVTAGRPVPALLETAEGADLLVVGSRGRGAVRSALLGSVALHCVTAAPCPVVVAHPAPRSAFRPPRVVVGVDGSPASRAALAAAVAEAAWMRAEVEIVGAYALPDSWTDLASVVVPGVDEIRADLQRRLEQLRSVAAAGPGAASVRLTTAVGEGQPGTVLVERARDADLLVVGSHGHGAIRGLLLGSVALYCAMHAPVPVMVVHERRERAGVNADGAGISGTG